MKVTVARAPQPCAPPGMALTLYWGPIDKEIGLLSIVISFVIEALIWFEVLLTS